MNPTEAATILALALPYLFAAGMFAAYLVRTWRRAESFAEFIPEQADVVEQVAAIDDAMLAALRGRTA